MAPPEVRFAVRSGQYIRSFRGLRALGPAIRGRTQRGVTDRQTPKSGFWTGLENRIEELPGGNDGMRWGIESHHLADRDFEGVLGWPTSSKWGR